MLGTVTGQEGKLQIHLWTSENWFCLWRLPVVKGSSKYVQKQFPFFEEKYEIYLAIQYNKLMKSKCDSAAKINSKAPIDDHFIVVFKCIFLTKHLL